MGLRSGFKRFMSAYIRVVQRILITVLLSVVYWLVVGLTALFALVFKFRTMVPRRRRGEASYWEEAVDYRSDLEDARRQS